MTHDEFVASLREIADFFETHPDCPLPHLSDNVLPIYDVRGAAGLAEVARQFGRAEKGSNDTFFYVQRRFGSITLQAMDYRAEVCERVVVGTETVTETIPDPDAPLVEQTREVEQVEYRCPPSLLAVAES